MGSLKKSPATKYRIPIMYRSAMQITISVVRVPILVKQVLSEQVAIIR